MQFAKEKKMWSVNRCICDVVCDVINQWFIVFVGSCYKFHIVFKSWN
jgi:hypothetical protein